jgi:Lrp/AsnC family transcriptional regulator, leucine-responsive regulatory protein
VDAIDRQIIAVLQLDGRISNQDLADRVGLSPSPCLRRVKALERDGVITGYRAVIDPRSVGRGFEVFVSAVLLRAEARTIQAFEDAVARVDEIVEVRRMMGTTDYLMRVVVADLEAYEQLYIEVLAALPGVERVATQLAMKTVKQTPIPVAPHRTLHDHRGGGG